MLIKHSLRKALSLLLCLSLLLTTGSPIFAEEGSENPDSSNFSSQVLLSDGGDTDPDSYTLNIDALVNSISAENEAYVPLDVAIVLDRSDSMSFPADSYDIKKFTTYSALENFLNTLDTDLWEGYYRATNLSSSGVRFYSSGATTSDLYTSWEALRYNKSTHQWEIFITTTSYTNQTEDPHGILPDTQYGYAGYWGYWVSPKEAFDEFQTRKRYSGSNVNNSGTQFSIAIPRLTKAQLTIEKFVRELNESACYLPEGQSHSVSITGFGGTLFQQGYQSPDSNVSFGSHEMEEYSCVCSAPSIPLTGGQTQYLDDFMSALKSQYVWRTTATDLAMMSVATNTSYLPPAQEGRQRVVILLTDGTPTRGMMFEDSVANEAIAYARQLKNQGVIVFTVSYMEGVTPQNGYNSAYNNTEEQKAGNFLHLISSNYPNAKSMTSPGAKASDEYFLADKGQGAELMEHFKYILNKIIPNEVSPLENGTDSLSIYHEITREFTIDQNKPVRVYVVPYQGNGTFSSTKYYIGEHHLTDTQDTAFGGEAYSLYWDHEIDKSNPDFPEADVDTSSIRLNWKDAKYAHLRENSAYYADSSYSDYTKGYRIGIEIPVVVDRNNTLGGNNILLGTEASGLYLSTIEDGSMQPDPEKLLIQENIPNANVPITIEFGVTDYHMSMETYLDIKGVSLEWPKVQNVFISMYGDVSVYIPNLMHQYTDIVHELYTASGELVSARYLFAGYQRCMLPMDEYPESFDFASDHELYFKAYTRPRGGETDSTGAPTIKSYSSYLPARYYAPTYEASPVEIKHTLNLESDISLNYLVAGASLSAYKEYYMTVEFCGETIRLEPEVKGNVTYFTLKNITAVDLTEEIRGTLHLFTEEGFYHCEEDVYSVADYAYGQLGKDAASAGLKTLCANLLRYGTLAQSYKGHNGKPADGDMSATHKSYLSDLSSVTANKITEALGDVDNGIPWVGKSLILDSKVSVKSIFSLADFSGSKEDLNLRVSYTDVDGEYVDIRIRAMETYSEEAQLYAFTLDTLLATEMRTPLTMALYNGDQQVSETQLYSVESYVSGRSGLLLELGKALLAYSDSARSFFAD